ncbi:ras-related and estrogen-regulated growth inhibitor-like protein [Oxyura jamaicensis]|uniref:ras-related and estrogen-regulated growth inhibitor-like protein n=1 Tax=Oxyura jamaicensis TaxID=8884 RepID=UPI0015A6F2E5|nr:ras-related and estrogen-regulated growth inhibitor-like protein [Oxyura jamaicensis]
MGGVKLVVLGSSGAALAGRFLTRRFIGEYASKAECIYTKHLSLDGRQIHLETYDPCSQPQQGKLSLTDELHWADGFIIVYDISDRASFAFAKALLYRIQESHIGACKNSMFQIIAINVPAMIYMGKKLSQSSCAFASPTNAHITHGDAPVRNSEKVFPTIN